MMQRICSQRVKDFFIVGIAPARLLQQAYGRILMTVEQPHLCLPQRMQRPLARPERERRGDADFACSGISANDRERRQRRTRQCQGDHNKGGRQESLYDQSHMRRCGPLFILADGERCCADEGVRVVMSLLIGGIIRNSVSDANFV